MLITSADWRSITPEKLVERYHIKPDKDNIDRFSPITIFIDELVNSSPIPLKTSEIRAAICEKFKKEFSIRYTSTRLRFLCRKNIVRRLSLHVYSAL
jgi:hypothetical protein